MSIQVSRRSFLKVGLIGAVTLAVVGGVYRMKTQSAPLSKFVLDADARSALAAIIPVILDTALPPTPQALDSAINAVQQTIAGFPLATQQEVQELFGLLVLGPTRRFLVGVPDEWSKAKSEDVAAFLQSWRLHRLSMLQGGYHALHDLIIGPWYGDESTWESIGYPGPIKELR